MSKPTTTAKCFAIALAVVAVLALAGCTDDCADAGGRQVIGGYQMTTMMIGKSLMPVSMPVYKCEIPN